MEENEGTDYVEDAATVEVPVSAEYAEWLQGLVQEASPLQTAQIHVNTLRIELTKVEEKIALGGPALLLTFLQRNRERKHTELGKKELSRNGCPASEG